jgi:hypothetical protein
MRISQSFLLKNLKVKSKWNKLVFAEAILNGLKMFWICWRTKIICIFTSNRLCVKCCVFQHIFNQKKRLFHFYIVMFHNFNIFAP